MATLNTTRSKSSAAPQKAALQWVAPTPDEIEQIEYGVFWQVDVETKEGLWPIWRDNQLRTGPLGRDMREMGEGEEELLLARFDKHWEEYVSSAP